MASKDGHRLGDTIRSRCSEKLKENPRLRRQEMAVNAEALAQAVSAFITALRY